MEHRIHAVQVLCALIHDYIHELEVLCYVLTKERKAIFVVEDRHHGICARPPGSAWANVCRQPKCSCRRYVRRRLLVLTATVYGKKSARKYTMTSW